MEIKIFRCQICGEVYVGKKSPATCPFCGVPKSYLVSGEAWKNQFDIELSQISKDNLLKALALEISNMEFYENVFKGTQSMEIQSTFKGLFKVEREHASVFRKMLKPGADPQVEISLYKSDIESIKESSEREKRAVDFYTQALKESTEPFLRTVFGAIMLAEKDHLALDEQMAEKIEITA